MELVNPTPLPGLAFRQFDQNGDLDCVVTLRGTFEHVQGGAARWCDDQMPLQWQDSYAGDPHETTLIHQGDLVPEKTGTDVTFLGQSYPPAPDRTRWRCGMEIAGVAKQLHVSGPRVWRPVIERSGWRRNRATISGWQLGEAAHVASVPLDWSHASGGRPAFGDGDRLEENPLGMGRIGAAADWVEQDVSAPQITLEATPQPETPPVSLAPIPPFWPQRSCHAGTFDEAWQAERHPLLPHDFDPRFWQCAPDDQIARPFLRGDESYRLTHLHPEHPQAVGRLPGLFLALRVDDGGWNPLNLDGVQFDWRGAARVLLTWRLRFPLPEAQGVKLYIAWRWPQEAAA